MLIRSEIDPKYVELELHVCKDAIDEEVARTLGDLHALFDESIRAVDERGNQLLLPLVGIYSFFAEGQRVYALDEKQNTWSRRNYMNWKKNTKRALFGSPNQNWST